MHGINQAEFEYIFNTWYEPIRNFLFFKTNDIKLAEDITQDAFLKIWEKRDSIRMESVKSLLYTIANNLFLNRVDHQKVYLKFALNFESAGNSHGPDFELELKEFDEKLQNAISRLDDKKRTVFLMNRIEKFTYNQIADNLGITVKAVEKRMEKALSFLRNEIEMNI
jgi:RNA polymerase sigma-70 factor (family 1)